MSDNPKLDYLKDIVQNLTNGELRELARMVKAEALSRLLPPQPPPSPAESQPAA